MERLIPNDFKHRIISSVFREGIKSKSKENYIKCIEHIETKWENYLIDILSRLDINASVKLDKYSLPYKDEIVFRKTTLFIFPKAHLAYIDALRDFVKVILERNLLRVRFYILVDLVIVKRMENNDFNLDHVELIVRFRFYGH